MRIVILDGYTTNPGDLSWDGFSALGELTVHDRTPDDEAEIVRRIGDAELVISNKTPLCAAVIAAAPRLRYIGLLSTGYNVVDLAAARARDIPVTNIPAYSTPSVAQMTFALLLEICNRVGHHSDAVHAGRWQQSVDFCFWDSPLIELMGKTMGLVGFGSIGLAVAKIAAAMEMEVLAYSRSGTAGESGFAKSVSLDELYQRSDIISLHCPLSPDTQGMIDQAAICRMKDGVILLNTARGPLVDEAALAQALRSGKVRAAGVDVVSAEPIRADNPLLGLDNCFITPHIAWAPLQSRARLLEIALQNLRCFLVGAQQNVVNP